MEQMTKDQYKELSNKISKLTSEVQQIPNKLRLQFQKPFMTKGVCQTKQLTLINALDQKYVHKSDLTNNVLNIIQLNNDKILTKRYKMINGFYVLLGIIIAISSISQLVITYIAK